CEGQSGREAAKKSLPRFDMKKDMPNLAAGKISALINANEYCRIRYAEDFLSLNKKIKQLASDKNKSAAGGDKSEIDAAKKALAELVAKSAGELSSKDDAIAALSLEYVKNKKSSQILDQIKKTAEENIKFVIDFEDEVISRLEKNYQKLREQYDKSDEKLRNRLSTFNTRQEEFNKRKNALENLNGTKKKREIAWLKKEETWLTKESNAQKKERLRIEQQHNRVEQSGAALVSRRTKRNLIFNGRFRFINNVVINASKSKVEKQ
ncbi:MAG: hypothetical protein WC198_05765, partial [Victivallaceae bacterium]